MDRSSWRDLLTMLQRWWNADRIRISPGEGQLLRIQPGDLLTIGGADVEVIDRSIETSSTGQYLRLNCHGSAGYGILSVTIGAEITSQKASWTLTGFDHPLDAAEIQVWPRSRHFTSH